MFAKKVSCSENYSYNIQLQVHSSSYENTQILNGDSIIFIFTIELSATV